MSIKVIGAGFGRTGTLSLKRALEELGFTKCYHMEELLEHPEHVAYWEAALRREPVNWDELFQGYQATVDFPGYKYYQEMMQYYPEAKVVLSVRDPEKWYDSAYQTIYQAGPSLGQKILMSFKLPFSSRLRQLVRVFRMAGKVWEQDFNNRFEDRKYAIELFNKHIEEVKRTVPADRLLIFDVKEGWEPLCQFLNVPVPANKPFPRVNERANFKQKTQELIQSV